MFRVIGITNIDFLAWRKPAFLLSGTVIGIGLVALVMYRGPNFGIDFSGGNLLHLQFSQPVTIADVRESLSGINLGESEIKFIGSDRDVLIRVPEQAGGQSIADLIGAELTRDFPGNAYEVLRQEHVGPRIGRELVYSAIYAILFSLIVIVLYVSIRFEFKFAVGALVALAHDVLVTVAVFAVGRMEFSLAIVAALLTIVGYSINDTIVIFDRIRENLKLHRKDPYYAIINRSVNETLSRTIITSGTVFLVVLVLYLFGGEVNEGFTLALLVGLIAGTYSTIYVANPIVVWFHDREEARARLHHA